MKIFLGAGCALAAAAGPAFAGSDTSSFTVNATVIASCAVSANDLQFGNYNPVADSDLDAATTLSVACTNGTPFQIALGLGGGTGASTAARYMTNGANTLAYTLYQDASRSTLWGETAGVDTKAGTGTGAAVSIDVYGRAPMHQTAPAGAYSDTIVVTVTY
ncbi:MAG: spore coat U domain-containing protein [Hyphomonadaceae bacterium]